MRIITSVIVAVSSLWISAIQASSSTSGNLKFNMIQVPNFNITARLEDLEKEATSSPNFNDRVLNGQPAVLKDFPFAVFIYIDLGQEGEACTGSLIAPNVLVTAAHCLVNDSNIKFLTSQIYVSAGSINNISDNTKIYKVSKLLPHPSYNPKTAVNDIGLVYLSTNISSNVAIPTTIYNEPIVDKMPVQAAGWGLTSNDENAQVSDVLNYVDINISSASVCKSLNPNWTNNDGFAICTQVISGKDTCFGDSGGPLAVVGPSLKPIAGLTSVGAAPAGVNSSDCGLPGGVAYYTNLKFFSQWISQQTNIPLAQLFSSNSSSTINTSTSSSNTSSSPKKSSVSSLPILSFISLAFILTLM